VVVVSYQTRETLRVCLQQLEAATSGIECETYVVDNASQDGSAAMVRSTFAWAKLIENQRNRGFGAACNQAIAASSAPFVLLLNSDCFLHPGAVRRLLAYLALQPQAAGVGPRLLNEDGSLQPSARRFPTPWRALVDGLGRGSFAGQHLAPTTYEMAGPRDYVSGACLLLRHAALDAVGGFDESYFLYAEEMDLAYRLKQHGRQIHYTPDAQAVHLGGRSAATVPQRVSGRSVWLEPYYAGQARFFRRHYGRGALMVWLAAMLLCHARGALRGYLRRRPLADARQSWAMLQLSWQAAMGEITRTP
jgi:GT2 family glycosyltransferase